MRNGWPNLILSWEKVLSKLGHLLIYAIIDPFKFKCDNTRYPIYYLSLDKDDLSILDGDEVIFHIQLQFK